MTTTAIDTRFFRAGVGTIIYNQSGQVALFERAQYPVGIWQFQQGGIDLGEDPETTLWRELREEVGLVPDDIATVTPYPHWTVHTTSESMADPDKPRLGQAHTWFFLELKADRTIDLSKASEHEASNWRFASFAAAISETEPHKKHVYQELEAFFIENIVPTLSETA